MPKMIEAVNANGEKQMVPDTWLQEGHVFADQFRIAPRARQQAERTPEPSDNWTIAQLREHAEKVGTDLTGKTTKADILTAITSAPGAEKE